MGVSNLDVLLLQDVRTCNIMYMYKAIDELLGIPKHSSYKLFMFFYTHE